MASYFKLFHPKTVYHEAFINASHLFREALLRGEPLDSW